MSMYGFFTSCLTTTQNKLKELTDKPRARVGQYNEQVKDIIRQIEMAYKDGELTPEQALYLLKEFKEIDFTKLSIYRKKG